MHVAERPALKPDGSGRSNLDAAEPCKQDRCKVGSAPRLGVRFGRGASAALLSRGHPAAPSLVLGNPSARPPVLGASPEGASEVA